MNPQMDFDSYIKLLQSGNILRPLCRLDYLRNLDESVQSSIIKLPMTGSSLTVDASNGMRRSLSLILDNTDKDFLPSKESLWIGFKFQLYLGLIDDDDREIWFEQGVFCVFNNDPTISSNYSEKTVSIQASDKMSLWDIPIGHAYIIPANTSLTAALRSILDLVGDKKAPLIQQMNQNCPYELRWSESTTYMTVLKDLANLNSCEIYYNQTGHLVFKTFVNQITAENIFTFSEDEPECYMGAVRNPKYSEVYNHVYVTGASMDSGTVYSAESRNDDLTSDTRIALIGEKPMPVINDSKIYNNVLCKQRSDMELAKSIRMQETINISCIALFHADVNKAVKISDDSIGLKNKRYIIQQYSMQIDARSAMTITGFLYSENSDFMDRLSMNTESIT